MSDSEVLARLRMILDNCNLTLSAASGVVGPSTSTLRYSLATGIMPQKEGPRRAIRDFVMRNANARSRADIKLA